MGWYGLSKPLQRVSQSLNSTLRTVMQLISNNTNSLFYILQVQLETFQYSGVSVGRCVFNYYQ